MAVSSMHAIRTVDDCRPHQFLATRIIDLDTVRALCLLSKNKTAGHLPVLFFGDNDQNKSYVAKYQV